MAASNPLHPALRLTSIANTIQKRRSGNLGIADALARRRASAALAAAARLALAGTLAAGALTRSALPAAAEPSSTYTVTNLNDSGEGSLRDAVELAGEDPGADVIMFESGLTGTIHLTTGTININSPLTITGPGPSAITVDGDGHGVVFNIYDITTLNISLSGLTITGGNGDLGGGIYIYDENVTLSNVVITGNNANNGGGIAQNGISGNLTIESSTISGNHATNNAGGIGMLYGAPLTMRDTLITGNTADVDAGGLYLYGYEADTQANVIERSTISNNQAAGYGGGVYAIPLGRAVIIRDTTISGNSAVNGGGVAVPKDHAPLTIENTTVADNTATAKGGGIFIGYNDPSGGAIDIRHTTIAGNTAAEANSGGGLIHFGKTSGTTNDPSVSIANTIIAANSANTAANDLATGTNGIFNIRYSLIQSPGAADFINTGGNITNQAALLGSLSDNGGPTQTKMPEATSPAIDHGDPAFVSPPATDQRGFPRKAGGRLDIGAVETAAAEVHAGALAFSTSSLSIDEDDGSNLTVTVVRSGGTDGAVSVGYHTVNGTAVAGSDYSLLSGTLNWAAGEGGAKTFTLHVIPDAIFELDETLSIVLQNPSGGAVLGTPNSITITIFDAPFKVYLPFTTR